MLTLGDQSDLQERLQRACDIARRESRNVPTEFVDARAVLRRLASAVGIELPDDLIEHFLIAPSQGWQYHDLQA